MERKKQNCYGFQIDFKKKLKLQVKIYHLQKEENKRPRITFSENDETTTKKTEINKLLNQKYAK